MNESPAQNAPLSRRWLWYLNLALGLLAVFALAGMANYFSHRHNHRAHWSMRLNNELSPLTLQVLQSVENPVRVVLFYDRRESLYRPIIELLRQYEELNPLLEVESVDYELEPAKASRIQSEMRLPSNARNLVIFHANQKTEVVPHGVLSGLSPAKRDEDGRAVFKRTRFNGEQMFTSALVAVSNPARPVVYYLVEHGTHAFNNTTTLDGYGRFSQSLVRMNIDLRPLSLSEKAVPADCRLLIVPGPRNQLDALSLSRLRDHLAAGGRQLILFRPHTRAGLEPLLADWGVLVGNDEVNDPGNSYGDGSVKLSKYDWDKKRGLHPVMRGLALRQMSVRMGAPCSVTDLKSSPVGGENVRRTVLASTGAQGLTYLRSIPSVSPNSRRVGLRGYIPVAMAVERDPPPGVDDAETVRLIVMGDSAWLNNALYDREANAELAWHIINWMLDRSQLLAIGPRRISDHQFSLTEGNRRDLMGWLLGVVPGSILGLGFLVWLRRRH